MAVRTIININYSPEPGRFDVFFRVTITYPALHIYMRDSREKRLTPSQEILGFPLAEGAESVVT
jgi:hypothetical protein